MILQINRIDKVLAAEGHIDRDSYYSFLKLMPVICVEVIIKANEKVLLIKRNQEPCKNQWCFPGGRLYKNESLEAAAIRMVRVETGVEINAAKLLLINEITFPKGQNGGQIHNLIFTYLVCIPGTVEIETDNTSSGYKLVSLDQENMASHVRNILKEYIYD
jgi:colanic acid biosynthesis protein WcaH